MSRFFKILHIVLIVFVAVACDDSQSVSQESVPGEDFEGPHRVIMLGEEADGLTASDIEITFLAENGVKFSRHAAHSRSGGKSTISLDRGLAEGTYRLLAAGYTVGGSAEDNDESAEFGFGSRISVTSEGVYVIDSFDPQLGYAGLGSKENPYIISSSSHLFNLMMIVNDYDSNRQISSDTYFMQVCDIDMKQVSRSCDMEYGWLPIGADTNTPFRGVYLGDGHKITNLIINRPHSAGIGLFGYVCEAAVDGLSMNSCSVSGQFAVGTVAGAVITSGGNVRGSGTFTNCTAVDCTVSGPATSAALGGILGATDMHARTLLADCSVTGGSMSGGMNVGGVTGGAGLYSSIMISGCENSTPVTSLNSGAGGMIGTADTLQVVGCTNMADIIGSTDTKSGGPLIGTGGIAGGSGISWITGSRNTGKVSGYEGVGGIIGSTRVRGSSSEAYIYNQSVIRHCSNNGAVGGHRFVGGVIGEAQTGTYAVCNTGPVSATDYVGGICGASSVAVIHNTINSGSINGATYVAGLVGKCTWGSFAIDQNLGVVTGTSGNTAGVVALAGNNTIVNYCSNFGTVSGPASHPVGGVVGEIGDPRKWTAANIAECVVGSLECVMAFAGPVLAIAENFIEMAESVEIIIKIVETSIEVSLQISDYTLLGYGIAELINPETEAELSADMHAKAEAASADSSAEIKDLRRSCKGNVSNFGQTDLSSYVDNVENVVAYYETEGNDEKFNEAINKTREERAEELEKFSEAKEIFHETVAGVAVVVSTVALVGGSIASGGTATAFLAAGSMAALVGGVNAIVKSCTDFENNAVVISQCVNAGKVSSSGSSRASSIVGKMCDNCEMYDCLNTTEVETDGCDLFAGDTGSRCEILRCVSLVPAAHPDAVGPVYSSVVCDPSLSDGKTVMYQDYLLVSPSAMSQMSTYSPYHFNIGDDGLWEIPAGLSFPIPNLSQMQD